MNEKNKDRYWVSLFLSLTLFFFGPYHMYFYNVLEYDFFYTELFLRLLVLSVLSTVTLSIAALFFCKIAGHKKTISLLLITGILFWLQGSILIWDYGQLDGKEIEWGEKLSYGIIDSGLWIILIIVALLKSATLHKYARLGSMLFIMIQICSLLVLFFQTPSQSYTRYAVDKDSKFIFSKGRNVIIIILDTFQTDIFQEIILEDSSYKDLFDGFTYFPNAVSGYPSTYPAIPLLLTGQYYDNSIPIRDFIKKTYASNSVPGILKKRGYHVYMYRGGPYIPFDPDIASNFLKRNKIGGFNFSELMPLIDFSFFRYLPHFTKKIFFGRIQNSMVSSDEGPDRHRDVRYFKNMADKSRLISDNNVFKYYHLLGTHLPYYLDENLEFRELETNRAGLKQQAKGILKITGQFLMNIKDLGIWEKSMIFILADHGLGTPESPPFTANNDMSYLDPLVLVKPFAASTGLKTSHAPVLLGDVPKTLFTELGINNNFQGYSMFELDDSSQRERRYLSFDWQRFGKWENEFLPPMKEYLITGNSWLASSWKETPYVYFPKEKRILNNYIFGTPITFGTNGNSLIFEKSGWTRAANNKNVSYAIGKTSSLVFYIPPVNSNLLLNAKVYPWLAKGKLKKQSVIIKVNGAAAGQWEVKSPGLFSLNIPREYVKNTRSINLTFELPDARSPFELGLGSDSRPLSIIIETLSLNVSK